MLKPKYFSVGHQQELYSVCSAEQLAQITKHLRQAYVKVLDSGIAIWKWNSTSLISYFSVNNKNNLFWKKKYNMKSSSSRI